MGQWKEPGGFEDMMLFQVRALAALTDANRRQEEKMRTGNLPSRFTLLEHGRLRLVVTHAPMERELQSYAEVMRRFGVKDVVRVCEENADAYDAAILKKMGFEHHQMSFADGTSPPEKIIQEWLLLVHKVFYGGQGTSTRVEQNEVETPAVAIHCWSGLGRAPLMAALALVQHGMDAFEAVGYIRASRRGAINNYQFAFLESFEPRLLREEPRKNNKPKRLSALGRAFSYFGSSRKAL